MNPTQAIAAAREKLGRDLTVLGHHYQGDDVLNNTDKRGDSLELARAIPGLASRYIAFCGVYFMAESAAILATGEQGVHTPRPDAKCVMAEMAPALLAERVFERLARTGRRIVPLTYVNSSAAVKALCGRHGGSVCTSANAPTMLEWALEQGDGVLFLPDKNLALNTANALDVPPDKRLLLDVRRGGDNLDPEAARKADLLVWPGCCATHFRFKVGHVEAARQAHPGCKIVVHPECMPEVVRASDGAGSTTYLINYVRQAPEGATVVVGTELNLVKRLAAEYAPGKTVLPLAESTCSNMAKTDAAALAALLAKLVSPTPPDPVRVPSAIADPASQALATMLDVCARHPTRTPSP